MSSTKRRKVCFIICGEDEGEHGVRHDHQHEVRIVVHGVGELRHALLSHPLRYALRSTFSLTTAVRHAIHTQTRKRNPLRIHLSNQQFHLATITSLPHRLLQHTRGCTQPNLSIHIHSTPFRRNELDRRGEGEGGEHGVHLHIYSSVSHNTLTHATATRFDASQPIQNPI